MTVRAARLGIIDFSKARCRDDNWWRRTRILLNALDRDEEAKFLDAEFRFHLALVANPSLKDESWNKSKEAAVNCFNELTAVLRPWQGRSTAERQQQELSGLRATYQRILGDPTPGSDYYNNVILPEVARMNALMNAARPPETAVERTDRLFKERILHQGKRRP